MKIIRKYRNGYLDVKAEGEAEQYFEKGDFIEIYDVDYKTYQIIDYRVGDDWLNIYAVKMVY